jgi:uncharacterized protein YegP (UPF0339 family)
VAFRQWPSYTKGQLSRVRSGAPSLFIDLGSAAKRRPSSRLVRPALGVSQVGSTKRGMQMAAWFELSNSSDDQFRFVLKAGNAEIILTSELYAAKGSAKNGIASVQANCGDDSRYERKTSSNGKPFFNLKAANHQVIGTSQMYSDESSRENGIASVKANGTTKDVRDNP